MTTNDEVSLQTHGFYNLSGSSGKTLGVRDLVIKNIFPVLVPSPIVPPLVETTNILFRVVVSYKLHQTPRISIKLKAPVVSSQGIPPSTGLEWGSDIKFLRFPIVDSDARQCGNH